MKMGLHEMKESWNSHYVRKSRYYTAHGIPDQLFFLPESLGTIDFKKAYLQQDLQEIEHQDVQTEDETHLVYQEYFAYSSNVLGLQEPLNWRDGLVMFERLIEVAE